MNYDNCEKDDYTIFRSDKTLTTSPGTIKCSTTDTDENGTWDFNSDQTKFQLAVAQFGGLLLSFDLLQLDDNTLKVKYVDNSTSGTVDTQTITFSAF
ncbi:MAG: hypothetical protein H7330_01780 [Hymenobacteraceae bacterium]|nr:hypothetical protein [Hymenobacteraceae bacterium]